MKSTFQLPGNFYVKVPEKPRYSAYHLSLEAMRNNGMNAQVWIVISFSIILCSLLDREAFYVHLTAFQIQSVIIQFPTISLPGNFFC